MKWLVAAALLASTTAPVAFRNAARDAGLTRAIPNGGDQSKKFIIETTGSGAAIFDFDNDNLPDLLLVSGDGAPGRFYRNLGRLRFAEAGTTHQGWGQGACGGDIDNDGFTDAVVTYWGKLALYRNAAGKRFDEVDIPQAGRRYNTGCVLFDYDRDGDLDLFVANYLVFDLATTPGPGANPYCYYRGLAVNCGPRGLPFARNALYRNDGNSRFIDVSDRTGISAPDANYSLGAIALDADHDGWPDLYVACDQTPSLLYMNQRDGTFREEALLRGVAFDDNGKALSGMGVAAADYDNDGDIDLFRTNFSDERSTLYRNRGDGTFDDATIEGGFGVNTRYVGWGCAFADLDLDGRKDLIAVNGHAFPEVDRLNIDIRFRDRALVYRNTGPRFADITSAAGPAATERHSSRGLALGDLDNDGSLEAVINNQNEPPSLWTQPARGSWTRLRLTGTRSNRSAIGARVRVTAGGVTQTDEVRSGSSYLSHHDLRLHFGLGGAVRVERVEVEWPSGVNQTLVNQPTNREIAIVEPAR